MLNPDLANWSITKFVDSIRFGLFKLVTVEHFDFCFFYWFNIVPGYHCVGERGVLKVETKKGSSKDDCPL